MKHFAQITKEFVRFAAQAFPEWWQNKTREWQENYIRNHPGTELRVSTHDDYVTAFDSAKSARDEIQQALTAAMHDLRPRDKKLFEKMIKDAEQVMFANMTSFMKDKLQEHAESLKTDKGNLDLRKATALLRAKLIRSKDPQDKALLAKLALLMEHKKTKSKDDHQIALGKRPSTKLNADQMNADGTDDLPTVLDNHKEAINSALGKWSKAFSGNASMLSGRFDMPESMLKSYKDTRYQEENQPQTKKKKDL